MASIDEQFVEFIVKSLVNNPDKVSINRSIDEKGVLLELTVDPEDLGRVIGKRGATAQSVRTLLRALGTKNDARYNLKIVDNGEPRPERTRSDDDSHKSKKDDDEDKKPVKEDKKQDESDADDVLEELKIEEEAEKEAEAEASVEEDVETESLAERTRKELADLDDLEV